MLSMVEMLIWIIDKLISNLIITITKFPNLIGYQFPWGPFLESPGNLGADHLKTYGGGGGGRSTKKLFEQGKIEWKKIHTRLLTLKNIHARA